METLSVLVTLPSLWQALPLQRQVKWKTANSHSPPVSHYIWTPLPSTATSHPFPHLFFFVFCRYHLRKTNLRVCLPLSRRKTPNTNSEKLFIVRRLLPPGVLVSQKALQMQWEISFLRSFIYLFIYLFFISLSHSLSAPPPFQNTEGTHANEWKPLIICHEVMRLTLPCGFFFFFFFPISAGKVLRGNAEVPWRYVTLGLTGEDYNRRVLCFLFFLLH